MSANHPIIGTGLICHQRDDGIYVYEFRDSRRSTIDAWAEQATRLQTQHVSSGQHWRNLFIIQPTDLSTYALKVASHWKAHLPQGLRHSHALLIEDDLHRDLLMGLLRPIVGPTPHLACFATLHEALAWLLERDVQYRLASISDDGHPTTQRKSA